MVIGVLLVPDRAPLQATLVDAIERGATEGIPLRTRPWTRGSMAYGTIADDDALDAALAPQIDVADLTQRLRSAHVPPSAAPVLAEAIADREHVLDLGARTHEPERPPTMFEMHALADVLGDELAALLPVDRVRIARAPLHAPELNHCRHDHDGVARIHLLDSNGTTLAGRTHALVHELGHALVGVARRDGRSYRAEYGQVDYRRFLDPHTFERPMDEEALVRAIADAWLLRRRGVSWARTWPGAVDEAGKDLDADDLAAFVRFRLAQGLGLPFSSVRVRKVAA
jgi:hypothetical protein